MEEVTSSAAWKAEYIVMFPRGSRLKKYNDCPELEDRSGERRLELSKEANRASDRACRNGIHGHRPTLSHKLTTTPTHAIVD